SLEIQVGSKDNETLLATIPPHRGDLEEEIDLIEEIARIHGYDQIPVTLPDMEVSEEEGILSFNQESKVCSLLADSGFFEVITYSFIASENIEALHVPEVHPFRRYLSISNPLSRDQSVMRTTLIPGLLTTVSANHNQKNMNLKIFELGKVFQQEEKNPLPNEKLMLGGLICGLRTEEAWNYPPEKTDFYDLKGVLENLFQALFIKEINFQTDNSIPYFHTGISSRILSEDRFLGTIGEVNPHVLDNFGISKKIFIFEIDFGEILNYCKKKQKRAKPLPKFPPVYRDIALVVDLDTQNRVIEEIIGSSKVRYLEEIKVFDVYQGDPIPAGKKGLAYRMRFQAPDRSLTDEEVNILYKKALSHLTNKLEVKFRK
ncbi:MAG: hypothetical protein JRJ08_01850, partial [Deltaproteobacteria bacterium]|nr:hypothetical protein [Deltaproteobacteria bacterium]